MQISSRNDTPSILSIARQAALAKASKDGDGSEGEASAQAASTAGGVSYSQGYSSFQSTLATTSVTSAVAMSGAERLTATGACGDIEALTQSDWDFIQKTTGLTWPNDKLAIGRTPTAMRFLRVRPMNGQRPYSGLCLT